MSVVFLNGSPRKDGYTVAVMKIMEEVVKKTREVMWLHAAELEIHFCRACMGCRPDGECVLPEDDGHRSARILREADILVVGSPTYFGNVSGALKTLFDRCLTAFETISANGLEMPAPLHRGGKAAIVTACNIPSPHSRLPSQAAGAIAAMETVLQAGGYSMAGSVVLDGAAGRGGIPEEVRLAARKTAAALL